MAPRTARIIISFVLFFVIVFIGMGVKRFIAGTKNEPPARHVQDVTQIVHVEKVAYNDLTTSIIGSGRVGSGNTVNLMAEVQGTLLPGAVALKQGTRFSKGQLLFSIDDEEARLNLQASRSQFLTNVANLLPDMKIDYPEQHSKWQSYLTQINVSQNLPELPSINSDNEKVFLASRNILNQYYGIKSAEENLNKYYIYAPFSGSYSVVNMESGTNVNPGSMIATIIPSSKLEIEMPVTVNDINLLKVGDPAVVSDPYTNKEWKGTIVRISENVDPTTQSLNAYINLSTTEGLYEGMYLEVEIPGRSVPNAMQIPRNALYDQDNVFLVQDSVLRSVSVEILKKDPQTVIFRGPDEGSMVVVEPLLTAYDGLSVKPLMAAE